MAVGNSVLDLAFAIDCTSSMGTYIKNATDNIRLIVDEIVTKEKVTVRLALIEYRDHPPQDNTFVTRVHSFTNTVTEMKGWLDQCSAEGGGDTPEAVADALNDALNLPWRSVGAKVCILISDAPPHGLVPGGDSFPSGCPAGHDPLTIVRKMAEKHITLYTVGVEPSIVPYRDFFMTLAHITGGQYVPMVDANRLAKMIIAGVREEISLDRLMHTARDDIIREVRKSTANGIDDRETATRLQKIFTTKKMYVNRMSNEAGTPTREAEESYSKCANMADMQKQYKTAQSVSNTKTGNMDYNLEVDSTVSFEQAKRIVQKAKNWNYSAGEQTNRTACRYKDKCEDHSSYHRSKYSHPETGNLSSRRNHETERSSHTVRNQERNLHSQKDNQQTPCQYQEKCYDHSDYHRAKYSHPQTEHLSSRRNQETQRNSSTIRNQERNSHSQEDDHPQCKYQEKCYDHSEGHRSKYSHPCNKISSTQRNHETERSDHRTPCKHGITCHDHSDYHRAKYSHQTTRH